ncbi:hypothetical protein FH972_007263 [Carpinus fangiana]|uniref:Uncharacterized protein n=1 Tax=Carpinus fangiana TaxID=176857 RepID=A0A5N6QV20_9ROSI|nr:hypothetical protein FH972_007263 [Carpinus fangiana]
MSPSNSAQCRRTAQSSTHHEAQIWLDDGRISIDLVDRRPNWRTFGQPVVADVTCLLSTLRLAYGGGLG